MSFKTLLVVLAVFAVLPLDIALAAPSSVDRITDRVEPLIKTDYIRAQRFVATSTTASVFPYASTTALSATHASTTGLVVSNSRNGLLITNSTGAVTSVATSSLGLLTTHVAEGGGNLYFTNARVLTYLDTLAKGYFFSTTSADHWQSQRNFFSTTSASLFSALGLAHSTTSTAHQLSLYDKGFFFSTTSADAWKAQRNFFSTTSASFFSALGLAWATSSANYWETQQVRTDLAFSTTSADYWKTFRNFFSTTSVDYWESTQAPRGGTGTVGTSTLPTVGHVAVWDSAGYPSLLGSMVTGSVSSSGGISVSGGRSVLGGALNHRLFRRQRDSARLPCTR